ncbi:MAG: restriction endonuclease subunit M [Tenericutes bacterium HGW-Tenericutes-2]|jgi:hypothetical protein|nr:MAG: restriction endonuclease subunit M [Tenericutes bacterium HGW-Tenericutes-2]
MNQLLKEKVDILENTIYKIDKELLEILLLDRTTKENIRWCTNNYIKHGFEYSFSKPISSKLIIGKHGNIIKPRSKKSNLEKKIRVKEKAEVFTPSWACNNQNNQVDDIWFGKKNVFNISQNLTWKTNYNKIEFTNKSWIDYVKDKRIEVTCGEAPYVVSRYDTVSGTPIEVIDRIGILDRKIRIINENSNDLEWYDNVLLAYKSVYGFEWQGDSLLIARENLLYSFIDYYINRFDCMPEAFKLKEIANIISWNFFQMDGLKGVIPESCNNQKVVQLDLFGEEVTEKCYGCENNSIHKHNGIYVFIKDWDHNKMIKFVDLLSGRK